MLSMELNQLSRNTAASLVSEDTYLSYLQTSLRPAPNGSLISRTGALVPFAFPRSNSGQSRLILTLLYVQPVHFYIPTSISRLIDVMSTCDESRYAFDLTEFLVRLDLRHLVSAIYFLLLESTNTAHPTTTALIPSNSSLTTVVSFVRPSLTTANPTGSATVSATRSPSTIGAQQPSVPQKVSPLPPLSTLKSNITSTTVTLLTATSPAPVPVGTSPGKQTGNITVTAAASREDGPVWTAAGLLVGIATVYWVFL
jgi:hypothetical protein